MFERYTEKARRVIFFARYEASQFGSPYIETEHLLLGLLREDKALADRFLRSHASIESVRKQVEAHGTPGEKVSTSVNLPLSQECKRVLAYAAEEAERLAHKHIGTEHLLLGLLREKKSFAAEILHERGLRLSTLREELSRTPSEKQSPGQPKETSLLAEYSHDLTEAARQNQLDPLIGREAELERVVKALCRRSKNHPVLIGEPGVGKTAMVDGLALRVAGGEVPSSLADKRILALDLALIVAGTKSRGQLEERLKTIVEECSKADGFIVFMEDLLSPGGGRDALDVVNILRPALAHGQIQCIGSATPADYGKATERETWLTHSFYAVRVSPPTEEEAIKILFAIKGRYEQFHGVTYTDEALHYAVRHSSRYISSGHLPDKAIDLIDEAGTVVKLGKGSLPLDVTEAHKRVKFIQYCMDKALANHEFEKASHLDDDKRKERENLRQLLEKHGLQETALGTVTLDDIEQILAGMTGIPLDTIRRERASPANPAGPQS